MTNHLFVSIPESEIAQEQNKYAGRLEDVGGDQLPFDHLSGQRFEILCYRLERAKAAPGDKVTLVKSTGDRGRDVLVYSSGQLKKAIQCKNQRNRLTRGDLVRELLTFALHASQDQSLLPLGTLDFSVWSASGFTEPAAVLIDSWPNQWSKTVVEDVLVDVIEKTAAFSTIQWEKASDFVLNKFSASICLTKETGIELALNIRSNLKLYQDFFQGTVVATVPDIEQALINVLSRAEYRQMSDEDVRHVVDRVQAQPKDTWINILTGYVIGISPTLMAALTSDEFREFGLNCMAPVYRNAKILMDAAIRMADRKQSDVVATMKYRNHNFRYVLSQIVLLHVLDGFGQLAFVMRPPQQPGLIAKSFANLNDQIAAYVGQVWDEMQMILARPTPAGDGDEILRKQIAQHSLDGYSSREIFEGELARDFSDNESEIAKLVAEVSAIFPREVIVVTDSKSKFEDEALLRKFKESMDRIEDARSRAHRPAVS